MIDFACNSVISKKKVKKTAENSVPRKITMKVPLETSGVVTQILVNEYVSTFQIHHVTIRKVNLKKFLLEVEMYLN